MNFKEQPQPPRTIDVSGFDKSKKPERLRSNEQIRRELSDALAKGSALINVNIQTIDGAPKKLLDQRGHIRLDSYYALYGEEMIRAHKHQVKEYKRTFLGADANATDAELKEQEEHVRMRDGNISEEVIFLMLNKILRDRFLVVRSSEYDDYENGIDLLLVDKKTGKTICAFDETVESQVGTEIKSRLDKKIARAQDRLHSGRGMTVTYGVQVMNNTMMLSVVEKVPPLFLAIDRKDLHKLLQTMDFDMQAQISDTEKGIFTSLIKKMQQQLPILKNNAHPDFSLQAVEEFIQYFEQMINKEGENYN